MYFHTAVLRVDQTVRQHISVIATAEREWEPNLRGKKKLKKKQGWVTKKIAFDIEDTKKQFSTQASFSDFGNNGVLSNMKLRNMFLLLTFWQT